MKATFLTLMCLPMFAFGEDKKLDVFTAREKAVPIQEPFTADSLKWLNDFWQCTDRALRKPPNTSDPFPHIDTMDFRTVFRKTEKPPGVLIVPQCLLLWQNHKPLPYAEHVHVNERGFLFGGPMADFLTFKRDPQNPPSWFLLEHQVSRDVFLFYRAKPKDDDENG